MIYYKLSQNYPSIIKIIERISNLFFRLIRLVIPKNNKSRVVLIISLHKIGDTIYTFPAVKRLINHYQDRIVLMTFQDNVSLYSLIFPGIKYVPVDVNEFLISGRLSARSARKKLRYINPGIIFDLTGSIRCASLIFSSRASKIAGINENQFRGIYDHFVPISYRDHLSEIYSNVADALGIPKLSQSEMEFRIQPEVPAGNTALIFPLAGWNAKEWGINKFIYLAKRIQSRFHIRFIIPEGGIKKDILNEICSEGFSIAETKSVDEMIEEIKKCILVICNDSGPSHVAELLNKKTVTLFGPTNPNVHKKKIDNSYNYFGTIKCSPISEKLCFTNGGRDCPSNECMNRILPEEVISCL